ncbi:MAG: L-serine ammonia-lyase [Thiohalophilus sp.]
MFISVLDLFKIGIGPSSSHTMGPMVAANDFIARARRYLSSADQSTGIGLRCTLRGSLAFTGRGHGTDRAVTLGLQGYTPKGLAAQDMDRLVSELWQQATIESQDLPPIRFSPATDIVFDRGAPLPQHPNGLIFELRDAQDTVVLCETYFSIGGGFISTLAEIDQVEAPLKMASAATCPYPFDSARSMLAMAADSGLSIAQMKRANELVYLDEEALDAGLDAIWQAMRTCVETGLAGEGNLPGGLEIRRRARHLHRQLEAEPDNASLNDWLSAYAIAVNEENAAGHMVVTAPTNGAAGVIPAVLYYQAIQHGATGQQIRDYLLTAGAIGGIIKHRSSISGAEVGCQGEVGSAAAMAAAGLCAVRGGTAQQIENAAEIALEHHLGMTCDPVNGLVQVPCIERNAFGAIKAHAAASLAIRESGTHFMPLDNCIAAMKQTGLEMSDKYKETALGGLAVSLTEC